MKSHLHKRLLLSMFALLIIGFTLLGSILLADAENKVNEFRETQARHQAKTLATSSLDGLVSEDYEVLEKLVHSSIPSEDYAYAAIVRPDGKILTHTNLLLIGEPTSTANSISVGFIREIEYNNRPVLEIIYPAMINTQVLANAHIGYYLDTDYNLQSSTISRILFVLITIFALIFTAIHFVTRSITIPIEKLTRDISSASLEKALALDESIALRNDEIGELAHAFIHMSNRLTHSHHELTSSLLANSIIVDSSIDGILVIDSNGTIESANRSCEMIFGYKANELVGHSIGILMSEPHRSSHSEYLHRYNDNEDKNFNKNRIEVEGIRKDGSKLPLEIAIGKISIGDELRYASTIRDISSRHEHEQALVLAKGAAEDGNRIKSEFLANISHELRTPMNSVLGYLDLINMESLPSDAEQYAKTATRSAEELMEIINNILEFTRLQKHEIMLDISQFSLRNIVTSLVEEYNRKHINTEIELSFTVDKDLPDQLFGDPSRIRNIIRHFLSNAYKFTKQGSISLNVDVLQHLQSKIEICVEVRDTGIGIEPINRTRIFELFTQADGSSTRRYGGTGIGLALCKKMVQSMSGEIGVDSEPDKGSVFWFSFQLEVAASQKKELTPITSQDILIQEQKPNYSSTRKILVVEDNPFNQDLMLAMLEILDYKADVANNGQLAVDAIRKNTYDLILMDCQMPVMNGFEATEMIRKIDPHHTPIVAVTAHALDGDRDLCIKSGMDDYMTKPFSKVELKNMIQKWLPDKSSEA